MLDTLLSQGEAEWTGLGTRRGLLQAVDRALEAGVESVNLCAPDVVGEELFSYTGSGTLFTVEDYFSVRPLALDEFAQGERLLERGQREGLLKFRRPEEVAQVLATAYGAIICNRHLAGVALQQPDLGPGQIVLVERRDLLEQRRAARVVEKPARQRLARPGEPLQHVRGEIGVERLRRRFCTEGGTHPHHASSARRRPMNCQRWCG